MLRAVLLGAAASLVALPTAFIASARTPYATGERDPKMQPVKFDHRHHVRDDGIPCEYCHAEARTSSTAGIPAVSVCMGCHGQILREDGALAPVRAAFFSGGPLAWRRVTRLPDHVFFDHSIHLAKGVGCVTCHGRVDLMGQVYAVKPFTMEFCLDCHRSPERYLRPLSRVTDMTWTSDDQATPSGRALAERLHVKSRTDCTDCHR